MPINNAINASATGLVRHNGAGVFDAVTTTNHDVLIGAASNGITNVAPSATSGVPLISQGAASDPTFGTAVVAGGGTGVTSFTAYSVVAGGTTTTGALQSVVSVGSSGQVLTSNGAAALPTWQAIPAGTSSSFISYQGSGSLSASNTYYVTLGVSIGSFTTAISQTKFYIPSNCTITKAYGEVASSGTLSSAQNATLSIRLNDTTNTTISTIVTSAAGPTTFNNTGLSIALSAGDYINFIIICPAWTTNPSNVRISVALFCS